MNTRTSPKQIAILAALGAVAALALWHAFSGHSVNNLRQAAGIRVNAHGNLENQDPALRLDLLKRLRDVRYHGSLRDLFHPGVTLSASANPAGRMPAKPRRIVPLPPVQMGPPPPPPIPLKFYGYAKGADVPQSVFLQMGDDFYVVRAGQVIQNRYQILSISRTAVQVKDLQSQQTQQLPLLNG